MTVAVPADDSFIKTQATVERENPKVSNRKKELSLKCLVGYSKQVKDFDASELSAEGFEKRVELIRGAYRRILKVLVKEFKDENAFESLNLEINFIVPLANLICLVSKREPKKDLGDFFDIFASLIWHHLKSPHLIQSFISLCRDDECMASLLKVLKDKNTDDSLTCHSISAFWTYKDIISEESGSKRSLSGVNLDTRQFLSFMLPKATHICKLFQNLINYSKYPKEDNQKSIKINKYLLELLSLLQDDTYAEFCALICYNSSEAFSILSYDPSKETHGSEITNICISKILSIASCSILLSDINTTAVKRDSFKLCLRNKYLLNFSPLLNHNNVLQTSYKVILDVLDQNNQIAYLSSANVPNYILLSLKSIYGLLQGKINLYSEFNALKPKISMTTAFLNLNYLLSINLCTPYNEFEVPAVILANFSHLASAPLPKPNYFFEGIAYDNSFDTSNHLAFCGDNFKQLVQSAILNLSLLSHTFKDEFFAYQFISSSSSGQLYRKIVFKMVDLMISSLFTTLYFVSGTDENNIEFNLLTELTHRLFFKMVTINLNTVDNSLIWVSLLNFANDICYADIKNVPIFEDIFQYLIREDSSILQDTLVKSGLQLFAATFSDYKSKWETFGRFLQIEDQVACSDFRNISIEEYGFLYPNQDINFKPISSKSSAPENEDSATIFNFEELANNISTPVKPHYATNSARQQSIHVDQYGMT
ncbi:uncharacterized protein PRCAT00002668001 [Priceomyces carsonii]|uniref:uncharacterized protein n=1 Tax=Priceomyces carsonii TaxID=28549 RepID=UPI002ED83853|nr:unnamed protein product [Priceomyces carsonii]